jgi:S-DNA-T family DNA segregation ATPase FtsK/SpoIIIE
MKILGPTPLRRLNELVGLVSLVAALYLILILVSFYPQDASWNTAAPDLDARNLGGQVGAYLADILLQSLGLAAFLLPALLISLSWHWVHSKPIEDAWIRVFGGLLLFLALSTTLGFWSDWRMFDSTIPMGGLVGSLLASTLLRWFNLTGSVLVTSACMLASLYLLTTFSLRVLPRWMTRPSWIFDGFRMRWSAWLVANQYRRDAERAAKEEARAAKLALENQPEQPALARRRLEVVTEPESGEFEIPIRTLDSTEEPPPLAAAAAAGVDIPSAELPWEQPVRAAVKAPPPFFPAEPAVVEYRPPQPAAAPAARQQPARASAAYEFPPMSFLNEAEARGPHDTAELKEIAVNIKAKFEEFNVMGAVTQINPGPVVTTFEFKPDAGVKYSRITTLTEDLCLGLQAESILIERIPGKPTVGIEVPNSRREVIRLRQILESEEFQNSPSKLTIAMGKDISGRIKVASLETMPHLLIAGSTGSGKSVMLNSLIMSVLYKATPDEVRMILVDPKRVEMGPYEHIPHLLTPVITDPRKATIALRNAVLEMERRLKLLASQGVRNIEQFNKKVKQMASQPRSLFEEEGSTEAEVLQPLPFILIVIDELADLMMLERQGVEESITRLAQMARAVGMHLVVATQRPSVDVITGLIKANFPTRMSFRVATRVDSRTILDVMGADHLLGKGDMLFLPPGSARLIRVHGAYVTETETADVTNFWKKQARPEYDQSFLIAPPEEGEENEADDLSDFNDPVYEDAVRVVCEAGKASTSTLQRRLRLGYGRAARMLDKMHHDGIIGPPDGSRPREVLRRPEWLDAPSAVG